MPVEKNSAVLNRSVEAVAAISIIPSLLEVVCRTTGMGFAAVARVTEQKWIVCAVRDEIQFGLQPGGELQLETTICNEIRQHGEAVIIDHVDKDEVYCGHHTPIQYGFQSYISIPIFLKDGSFFGTLCAIDPKPANINNTATIGMFTLFAELISFHLNAVDKIAAAEFNLREEKQNAELREQFIAILGHDLKNPVSSISLGADVLLESGSAPEFLAIVQKIKHSSVRMNGLINNILDFARGRLGAGIVLERKDTRDLPAVLQHVADELQTAWPGRVIDIAFNFTSPVNCDSDRIAQLFSNLLANALVHSKNDAPVKVMASGNADEFTLEVMNQAEPINKKDLDRLFQPFYRGQDKPGQHGLGLGLFIAAEIARAHQGKIDVSFNEGSIYFTTIIPQVI